MLEHMVVLTLLFQALLLAKHVLARCPTHITKISYTEQVVRTTQVASTSAGVLTY